MSGFELITPGRDGYLGLVMDPRLPKNKRGKWMAQACLVRDEKDKGLENPQGYFPSDPANAFLWASNPARNGPRGSAKSWSFAVPAKKQAGGKYLPLETPDAEDHDFAQEKVTQMPFAWYGGEYPGGIVAAVLSTTSHFNPQLVAFAPGGPIVSHHLGNSPPKYSRWFWDIKGDEIDPDRGAGAHSFTRVRRMPRIFCSASPPNPRQTVTGDETRPPSDKLNAVMLNGTQSAGDHTGWLSTHFGIADAGLSHEIFGFARPGPKNRRLGQTEDGDYRAAALDWDRHLFSDGTDANTGPLQLLRTQWERGSKGPIVKLVEARIDRKQLVAFLCGPRPGMIKFQTWDDWGAPPPVTREPKKKKPKYPRQPGDPGTPITPEPEPLPEIPRQIIPGDPTDDPSGGISVVPYEYGVERQGDPLTSTPYEAASPSIYGLAMPGLPDGSRRQRNISVARSETEGRWLAELGMTPAEFYAGAHLPVHIVSHAKLSAAAAAEADSPAARWPVASSDAPVAKVDPGSGAVTGWKPGFAPGALVVAAGNVPRHKIFLSQVATQLRTPDAHSLIVLAGAEAGPTEVHAGRIALGQPLENSARVASGMDIKLTYSGAGGITTPDVRIYTNDETGAADTGSGAKLYFNDVDLSSGGSGDVVGPGSAVDSNFAAFDTTTGKLIKDSGIALTGLLQVALDLSDVADAETARSNLGLEIGADVQAYAADTMVGSNNLSEITSANTARNNLGLGALATLGGVNNGNWSGTDLAVANGGTGASDIPTALSNLGTLATVAIAYSGSGSSGKTVTLTGINRASFICLMNTSNTGTIFPMIGFPSGGTGAFMMRLTDGNDHSTFSLDAPAAGSSQTLTINNTFSATNLSGNTYRLIVVGTPI